MHQAHTPTYQHSHPHPHIPALTPHPHIPVPSLSILPSSTSNRASHGHSLESKRLSSLDLRNRPGFTTPSRPILVATSWCSRTSLAVMEVGTAMHSKEVSFLLKNTTRTCVMVGGVRWWCEHQQQMLPSPHIISIHNHTPTYSQSHTHLLKTAPHLVTTTSPPVTTTPPPSHNHTPT